MFPPPLLKSFFLYVRNRPIFDRATLCMDLGGNRDPWEVDDFIPWR